MTIRFDIPLEIEQRLRSAGTDPNQTAKESLLVELYRQKLISHHQISQALGFSCPEVDVLLERHDVPLDLSIEEFRSQASALRQRQRR